MNASEARELAAINKMNALEEIAKTSKFKNNINRINLKIKTFCELGDFNTFFNVTDENPLMIEALVYYFKQRDYNIEEVSEELKKYLHIKW